MSTLPLPLTSDEHAWLTSYVQECPEEEIPDLEELLGIRDHLTLPSCPKVPTPRQSEFIGLTCEEALFGGAAGGGKSEALLQWLGEGIPYEGYSGIIFRRTYPQLTKSQEALIPKSFRLYKPMGGVFNGSERAWKFPKYGSRIEFGHLPHSNSIYDYQGPAYNRVAWDELTQFEEPQYLYMFSRTRREHDFPIAPGIRCGSNPGGVGHNWVRKRFVSQAAIESLRRLKATDPSPPGQVFWTTPDRAFVPARLADNPYYILAEYQKSLAHLDPVTREQLMNGDWGVSADGRFKPGWARYWSLEGPQYRLFDHEDRETRGDWKEAVALRFITVDPAGTARDRAAEAKKGKPCSSACSVWDFHRQSGLLFWRGMRRGMWEAPELIRNVVEMAGEWRPAWVGLEYAGLGLPIYQVLASLPQMRPLMRKLNPEGKDKLTRATTALNMAQNGLIVLPREAPWKYDLEAELFTWQGTPDEQADQIDTLAYAATEAARMAPRVEKLGPLLIGGL